MSWTGMTTTIPETSERILAQSIRLPQFRHAHLGGENGATPRNRIDQSVQYHGTGKV